MKESKLNTYDKVFGLPRSSLKELSNEEYKKLKKGDCIIYRLYNADEKDDSKGFFFCAGGEIVKKNKNKMQFKCKYFIRGNDDMGGVSGEYFFLSFNIGKDAECFLIDPDEYPELMI